MSVIIITGASKGIGRETAARFIEKGDQVINISRTRSELDGIHNAAIDLSASDADMKVAQLFDSQAPDEIHLIHNAAKLVNDSVRDVDAETFRSIIELPGVAKRCTDVFVGVRYRCRMFPECNGCSRGSEEILNTPMPRFYSGSGFVNPGDPPWISTIFSDFGLRYGPAPNSPS